MKVLEFETDAGTIGEKRRQWCAATGAGDVDFDDDGINASIRGGDVGVARICSVAIGGQRVTNALERARPNDAPLVKLVFQEEGECCFEQGARSVTLHPGEWCAYDKNVSYCLRNSGLSRQSALVLPAAAVDRTRGWDGLTMVGYSYSRGADYILYSTLVAAVGQLDVLSDVGANLVSHALLRLLETTLLSKGGDGDGVPLHEMRRAEILNFIEHHLDDPELSIDAIARAFSCSKRYLHKLFLDHGTTIGRAIWNRRLDHCQADLGDPKAAGRSVTEIAFAWGFNDSHHFSRLFKERFGLTPRDFRRKHCAH